MPPVMIPWKRKRVTQNPYHRTAFRVARVPREIVRYKVVSMMISQTNQVVNTDASVHAINGAGVDPAELNWASSILLDPQARILEELIHHSAEKPETSHLKSLSEELRASWQTENQDGAQRVNLGALRQWLPELAVQALEKTGRADPLFGAGELNLVPPFGTRKKIFTEKAGEDE